jgi:ribonucleotide reductase class II
VSESPVEPAVLPGLHQAPCAYPVFFRTYSRRVQGVRESWDQVCERTVRDLAVLGRLTPEETALVLTMQRQLKALTSGRWLWIGGTEWIHRPENFSGAYNCTSQRIQDWRGFGLMMDLAMQGAGTGAVLERQYVDQLPPITTRLVVTVVGQPGDRPAAERLTTTQVERQGQQVVVRVGDSRQGWVQAYQTLLELASDPQGPTALEVTVDVSHVRPKGEVLKGFGGIANPALLPQLFPRVARILNRAVGRKLTPIECCLLIDEAAATVVAGNIRRSAGMRQFSSDDEEAAHAKANLWQQDEQGNWRIDPERDALRMANHTRVFHHKPSREECLAAVRSQFYSGEGAIQWAGEAIARANRDILNTPEKKARFLALYAEHPQKARAYLRTLLIAQRQATPQR